MSETEKQMADRVLRTLATACYLHAGAAVGQIEPLREQVGSGGNVERERADAWLAKGHREDDGLECIHHVMRTRRSFVCA